MARSQTKRYHSDGPMQEFEGTCAVHGIGTRPPSPAFTAPAFPDPQREQSRLSSSNDGQHASQRFGGGGRGRPYFSWQLVRQEARAIATRSVSKTRASIFWAAVYDRPPRKPRPASLGALRRRRSTVSLGDLLGARSTSTWPSDPTRKGRRVTQLVDALGERRLGKGTSRNLSWMPIPPLIYPLRPDVHHLDPRPGMSAALPAATVSVYPPCPHPTRLELLDQLREPPAPACRRGATMDVARAFSRYSGSMPRNPGARRRGGRRTRGGFSR